METADQELTCRQDYFEQRRQIRLTETIMAEIKKLNLRLTKLIFEPVVTFHPQSHPQPQGSPEYHESPSPEFQFPSSNIVATTRKFD